jgi:MFS family permease
MGASVLNGIAAGPAETIQPAVIADIFFLHDRGFWNTLYWCFYMGSLMVAPIISGSMALHVGWRSFWWLNTGLLGLSVVLAIVAFPETKWHRMHPDEMIKHVTAEAKASPALSTEGKEDEARNTVEDTEKPGGAVKPTATADNILSHAATAERDPWLGKGSPSKQQWKLFQPNKAPFTTILMDLWIPWKLFAFPIVEFSAFVVSWSCSSFLTINLTQSQNFAAPPYLYNSEVIGFFNFAILIGAAIGLATAGKSIDPCGPHVSQGWTTSGPNQCCLMWAKLTLYLHPLVDIC